MEASTVMLTSVPRSPSRLREIVSAAEWDVRVKLAACYRLMAHNGVTDLTYNHLSARIPDQPNRYAIKGEHQFFDEVTASSLLVYDFSGERIYPSDDSVSRGGLVIHGGVMEARPDIMAVFHTHTPANMGVSAQRCGLLPITQHAVRFHNRIGYHDFGGFEFDLSGRERLVRDLEGKLLLMLRNHGVLACGRSIPEAYINHHFLEMACQSQVAALSAGGPDALFIPSDAESESAALQAAKTGHRDENHRDWGALLRLADRIDPSFRD
jgi:ribulose-5-phosphate 4-epimerase/fuculose-1-phosphate aldolase